MPHGRRGLWWTLSLSLALPAQAAAPPADVGFVLEARGPWQLSSGGAAPQPLVAGQAVRAGDRLLPGSGEATLTVMLLDGKALHCPAEARCAAPLQSEAAKGRTGGWARLAKAIGGLFSQPERYAATMSRGEEVREAVGVVKGGRVDLGDALSRLPAGTVPLVLVPLDDAGAAQGDPLRLSVDPAATGPARTPRVEGAAPGLYRVQLESGAEGWVYLAAPARFRAAAAGFARARAVAEGMGKEVSGRASRGFLRAALHAIARDAAPGAARGSKR